MEFKERLKNIRKEKGLSQSQLAKAVGVHVTNISRYERGENKPTSEVLQKLADELDISADYLMSGHVNDKAQNVISNKELLSRFKKLEQLPEDKRAIIVELIDAFIFKNQVQQLS